MSQTRTVNEAGNDVIEIIDAENDIKMDVEIVPPEDSVEPSSAKDSERAPNSGKLRVAMFGRKDSPMIIAQKAIFNHSLNLVDVYDDIDKLIGSDPMLSVVCADFNLNTNDTQDDTVLIDALKKIEAHTQGGILLKTVVTPETMIRILSALKEETVQTRFVYSPDLCDSENVEQVLDQDTIIVGAVPEVYNAHTAVMSTNSNLFLRKLKGCTHLDAAVIKLSLCAYRAVKQTFFNQLHDYVSDFEMVNYNNIRAAVDDNLESKATDSLPTYIKQVAKDNTVSYKKAKSYKGEFDNKDIRAFVGSTEKLSLLDECVNIKNLKD